MAPPTATTRRGFLRGESVGRAVHDLLDAAIAPSESGWRARPEPSSTTSSALLTATRRAMACQFQVALPVAIPCAAQAATAALDVIDELEQQMTVYRDSSELCAINRMAATAPVIVELRLFELFETAIALHGETAGAFEIAAGALIRAWGYFQGPKRVPEPAELALALERSGSRFIALDRANRTITLRRPGVELNLGAIGKGYALDRAAELLGNQWGVTSGLLHGGRSSVLALGSPIDGNGCGWLISIGHPFEPGTSIATIRLRDAALGTSGTSMQYFEAQGRRWGHILDPRTGWPADSQSSVSVIAPSAALADALSTAFFILGPDRASEYCSTHPEIGAVLISARQDNAPVQLSVVGAACELVETHVPNPCATVPSHRRGALLHNSLPTPHSTFGHPLPSPQGERDGVRGADSVICEAKPLRGEAALSAGTPGTTVRAGDQDCTATIRKRGSH